MQDLTPEDLAAIEATTATNLVQQARDEVERHCAEFRELARLLRQVDQDYQAKSVGDYSDDPDRIAEVERLRCSRERIMAAAFCASDRVHEAQRKWMLAGIDVYVSHTTNGSPIRVNQATRSAIIGYN